MWNLRSWDSSEYSSIYWSTPSIKYVQLQHACNWTQVLMYFLASLIYHGMMIVLRIIPPISTTGVSRSTYSYNQSIKMKITLTATKIKMMIRMRATRRMLIPLTESNTLKPVEIRVNRRRIEKDWRIRLHICLEERKKNCRTPKSCGENVFSTEIANKMTNSMGNM